MLFEFLMHHNTDGICAFGFMKLQIPASCYEIAKMLDKTDSLLCIPNCLFVLYVGTKKPAKRKEFEQFIGQKLII